MSEQIDPDMYRLIHPFGTREIEMITKFLLFEEVDGLQGGVDEFIRCNPMLDESDWNFRVVGNGDKVRAEPKNGKSFFVKSPAHFWKWVE